MRSTRNIAAMLALSTFTAFGAVAQNWSVETVGQNVQYVDFTIDEAGTLHVLYADGSDPAQWQLIYAFDTGAGWQSQTVAAGLEPNPVGIAVDELGLPHITFVDSTATVQYGIRNGGSWTIEPLPAAPIEGYPYTPSIAVDASGEPHIAYQTYGERIQYVRRVSGVWTNDEVDDSAVGLSQSRVCVAIDPAGILHLAARQTFDGPALFTLGGSVWTHENFGIWGYRPWVVYDDEGFAHYIYWGDGTSYATDRSGAWEIEILDPDTLPELNDIALDRNGVPGLSYSKTIGLYYEEPDIHYQTRIYFAYDLGDSWQREEVDIAPDFVGAYYIQSCVDFDADNVPHMLYRHPGTGELRHAARNWPTSIGDVPSPRIVENLSVLPNPFNPNAQISFRLSRSASVRIAIYDQAGRSVRTLPESNLGAGEHARKWDGRDDGGRSVASGVYFVRLEAGDDRVTRKLALVR